MIQHIIFAADGSAPAQRAGDFTASLATRYGARVTVLHAFAPMPTFLCEPYHSQMLNKVLREAETLIEDTAKRLREKSVTDIETDILEGSAAVTILRVVEIRKPDLLIVGRRGLSIWKGLILGSVSMAVIQRAESPALVVK
jgi:nucleotide-binding universal stress UspA family protein